MASGLSQVEKYRLQTLRKYLGDQRVSTLLPSVVCKYRDQRLKAISPASLKQELTILSSVLNTAIKEWGYCYSTKPRINGFITQDNKGKR